MPNASRPQEPRMMPDDFDWTVLDRYFSGKPTPADVDAIGRWTAADADHAQTLEFMKQVWAEAGTPRPVIDEERAWLVLQARIGAGQRRGLGTLTPRTEGLVRDGHPRRMAAFASEPWSRSLVFTLAGIAAVLATVMAAVVWRGERRTPAGNGVPLREYTTNAAQRAAVQLSDGTQAMLSPASRLRVMTVFDRGPRVVELEGEAYFVVKHDPARPFRVSTARVIAEDLGTAFMVRAHASDTVTEITVVEGEVALRATERGAKRRVVLARGQMGRVQLSGTVSVESGVDLDALLARTEGRLVFRKTPLAEVRRELERWYDVRIAVSDSQLDRVPVSATFDNKPMDDALRTLARLLSVRYERDGMDARLATDSQPP